MTDKEYETVTKLNDHLFRMTGMTTPARTGGDQSQRPHSLVNPVTKQRAERITSLSNEYTHHDFRGSPCLTASARFFRARAHLHYMHFMSDFTRALRKCGYLVRQRTSVIRKKPYTVRDFVTKVNGPISKTVTKQLANKNGEMPDYFAVLTHGHIHVIDFFGKVMCDTAPVEGEDTRQVLDIFGVWY